MNQEVKRLINDVEAARSRYLNKVNTLSQQQALWKPSPEVWNVVEITEHLFWAIENRFFHCKMQFIVK